jgi:hypothetical protein
MVGLILFDGTFSQSILAYWSAVYPVLILTLASYWLKFLRQSQVSTLPSTLSGTLTVQQANQILSLLPMSLFMVDKN